MEKYLYHAINNPKYIGMITILDYEARINTYLSKLTFPSHSKKILIDLALKPGLDEYRFVAFDIDTDGVIILDSNKYVTVSKSIEYTANHFLQEKRDIVINSFLTDNQKQKLLN